MRYRLLIVFLVAFSTDLFAQMESLILMVDNKTPYAFTCKLTTGEIFTITDKMNKEYATVAGAKGSPVVIYAGVKGTVTWIDNTKGASFTFSTEKTGKSRTYNATASHHFKTTILIGKGIIEGKDIIKLEITGGYEYKPPPSIVLPNYGEATLLAQINLNTAQVGNTEGALPEDALDISITVPDIFYITETGSQTYSGRKGYFSGIKNVDATISRTTGMSINEAGDTIIIVQLIAKGIPENAPVSINVTPVTSDIIRWRPSSVKPSWLQGNNISYLVFAEEEEPVSPHYSADKLIDNLVFTCTGRWWDFGKIIPAEIITQKNFIEKFTPNPGKDDLKNKERVIPIQSEKIQKNTRQNKIIINR